MKKQYLQISRPEMGHYIVELKDAKGIIDAELDGMEETSFSTGDKLILEIVEMEEEEYK